MDHPLRCSTRALVLGLLTFTLACSDRAEAPFPVDLLITDVHLIDVDAAAVVEDRSIAIEAGVISGIWPAGEVPRGLEARAQVDGRGRYVIPGLWDAHVHFRGGETLRDDNRELLALYPAFGVTTVRDAGGDLTHALREWSAAIDAGSLVGPEILTSGPKLDGPRPSWDGSLALTSPDDVPAAFDSLQALDVDYVKLYDGSMPAEVFLASVREAEDRDMTISGHMPLGVDFLEAIEAGLDATEHLYYVYKGTASNREEISRRVLDGDLGFWDSFWAMLGNRDADREAEVFAAMVAAGTAVVPTLHIGEILSNVELVDHSDDALLPRIPQAIQETYAGRVQSARRGSEESRTNNRQLRVEMIGLFARMHDAGVTVLAGSDAGPFNSYTYPGEALHAELEAMVEAGLTPAEALQAATVAPAAFMNVDAEVGRIAPGFRADLVLLDANPLDDITATRSRSTVILKGRTVLDRDDIEELLRPAG